MTRWSALEICAMASFVMSIATCVGILLQGLTPLTAGLLTGSVASALGVMLYDYWRG